jgi:hypothetical protein
MRGFSEQISAVLLILAVLMAIGIFIYPWATNLVSTYKTNIDFKAKLVEKELRCNLRILPPPISGLDPNKSYPIIVANIGDITTTDLRFYYVDSSFKVHDLDWNKICYVDFSTDSVKCDPVNSAVLPSLKPGQSAIVNINGVSNLHGYVFRVESKECSAEYRYP